jgi:hypothetical protein
MGSMYEHAAICSSDLWPPRSQPYGRASPAPSFAALNLRRLRATTVPEIISIACGAICIAA